MCESKPGGIKVSHIRMPEKMEQLKILFICLGNICRSPAAEGIMKKVAKDHGMADNFFIDSAGIGDWHVGQLPDIRMRRCGATHGYTFDSRARQFMRSDFQRFDYIIVMDHDNLRAVSSMAQTDSERGKIMCMADFLTSHREYTSVPDPYYGDAKDFELVIQLLEDACEGLYQWLTKQ